MMFTKNWKPKIVPQSQPLPGAGQTQNHAGGYSWAVSPWALLDRFLILGTEGGTIYVRENQLTETHAKNLLALIGQDGLRVVARTAEISHAGRAPKNDAAIFALALAAAYGNEATRQAAYAALPQVCRTGTHLFQFAAESAELRGWGRGLRRAVAQWYNVRSEADLAHQAVKYQQRNGWAHRDLLRLAHPVPNSPERKAIFRWMTEGNAEAIGGLIEAFERLKTLREPSEAAKLIADARLPREAVPTELLAHVEVWEALLPSMGLTAMLRNLATMTRANVFDRAENLDFVSSRLTDMEALRKARVHPLAVLLAQTTYAAGQGHRGSGYWVPEAKIVKALETSFRLAFGSVEPTGKATLVGLDVSGSMGMSWIAGTQLSALQGAVAMGLVTASVEQDATLMAFSHELVPAGIKPGMSLDQAMKKASRIRFGATDCALPMLWAKSQRLAVDTFVVYTDNETWFGKIHPAVALEKYRQAMGRDAKLVVVGMTATEFSIADPRDAGMLDVVGFDAATPQAIAEFAKA